LLVERTNLNTYRAPILVGEKGEAKFVLYVSASSTIVKLWFLDQRLWRAFLDAYPEGVPVALNPAVIVPIFEDEILYAGENGY